MGGHTRGWFSSTPGSNLYCLYCTVNISYFRSGWVGTQGGGSALHPAQTKRNRQPPAVQTKKLSNSNNIHYFKKVCWIYTETFMKSFFSQMMLFIMEGSPFSPFLSSFPSPPPPPFPPTPFCLPPFLYKVLEKV